jgi:Glycosyl transferase family 1
MLSGKALTSNYQGMPEIKNTQLNLMKKKTVMLAVQGEGRGHMTQAIAVLDMLKKSHMEVCCVIVGSSNQREIPDFFRHKFDVPVIAVQSPNFTTGKDNKSIQIGKTIWNNTLKLGAYHHSLAIIHKLVGFHNPDIIINFFEPLIGLYRSKIQVSKGKLDTKAGTYPLYKIYNHDGR